MIRRIVLILAGFGLAAATAAQAQEAPASEEAEAEPTPELKALADSCDAHKFETMVVTDGSGRGKRVKICGKPGQTDADWLVTLRDSAKTVEADLGMAQPVRDQILAALKIEIDRVEELIAARSAPTTATIALPERPVIVPEAAPQYSSVPPLPAPKPKATGAQVATTAQFARPRLTVRCALPREIFAACARLERETQLMIRADENLADGTSLRFVRGGDTRAELELGALKEGESLRKKLPGRVCSGVLRGKVEVQILSKHRVAETLGPYNLYCGS